MGKLSLLKRKSLSRQIGDQAFVFHPLSIDMLFHLKSAAGPIAKAVSGLLAQQGASLSSRTAEQQTMPDGTTIVTHQVTAAAPDVLSSRRDAARASAEEAVEAILGGESRRLLISVVADSLRHPMNDEFERDFGSLDIGQAWEVVSGVLDANREVFAKSPFARTAAAIITKWWSGQVAQMASEPAQEQPEAQDLVSFEQSSPVS